jgi:hypothetical protein
MQFLQFFYAVENVSNEEYFVDTNKVIEAVFENAQFSSLKINF